MKKRLLAAIAGLAVIASLSACSGGAGSAATGKADPGAEPLPIRIGYTASGLSRLYTAMDLGLFAKNGLKPELTRFDSGAASAAAFKSGSIDVGFTGVPGFASARVNGSDVQIFLTESEEGAGVELVARPDSGIKSVKDLAGKTVGTAVGTVGYVGLVKALKDANVPITSVKVVNLAPNTWVSSFRAKQVDAIFAFSPANYVLEAAGGKSITSLDKFALDPIVWIGRSSFLKEPNGLEAAKRFIAAMDEAGKLYPQNKAKVLDFMASQNGQSAGISAKVVAGHKLTDYADQLKSDSTWSLTSPIRGLKPTIEDYVSVLMSAGVLTKEPDLATAFDPAPLQRYVSGKSK